MTILAFLAAAAILAAAAYGWHAKGRRTAEPPKRVGRRPAAASPAAHGGRPESDSKSGDTTTTTSFACVEMRVPQGSCSAAKAIARQSFLASEAPALPLEGCTASRCRCSFHKSSDRRQDKRRWKDDGVEVTLFSAAEKRKSGDRRQPGT